MATLVNPPELARAHGYSHGAWGEGRVLALAGQIGWDAQFEAGVARVRAAVRAGRSQNLNGGVARAAAPAEHLISLRIYVTDKRQYTDCSKKSAPAIAPSWASIFRRWRCYRSRTLLEEGALVEIEGRR